MRNINLESLGSHSSSAEDSGEWFMTFQRTILASSSELQRCKKDSWTA
jgi:hypothetical protein